jgi:filamentous hemagglutinin family protein
MQRFLWPCSTSLLVIYFLLSSNRPVSAHPLPDNTLGAESSVVTPIGQNFDQIEGGALRGNNLFHSFQRFDIQTGDSVYFNPPNGVANIFSRVTGGGSPSSINGRLGANSNANLFFINPNGIIFGPSATLDLKGSFIASTASNVLFSNGSQFGTINPQPIPLLTVDALAPIGLQFESEPGGISVERAKELSALTMQPGRTLALIGGDIRLNGASLPDKKALDKDGTLRALGGQIILGGLAESGVVQLSNNLQDLHLFFPPDKIRADVTLSNGAQVITRFNNGGSISVHTHNLELTNNSKLVGGINVVESTSDSRAGNITIDATGEVILRGGSVIANDFDEVTRAELTSFLHQAGDIQITADILSLSQDSVIVSSTRGRGNAGSLVISANKIDSDHAFLLSTVGLGAIGNGGNIQITTGTLDITNKSIFSVGVAGSSEKVNPQSLIEPGNGNAGRLTIKASKFININNSYILSELNEDATGAGGNITIDTDSLSLSNQAALSTGTKGNGNAGDIEIHVSNTASLIGKNTTISSDVGESAIGKGGIIKITAGSLLLSNESSISTALNKDATGAGGNIMIDTDSLSLSNQALLSTGTRGQGNAGRLSINASKQIDVSSRAEILSDVGKTAVGQGGEITINTDSLSLSNQALLLTSTGGQGNAGRLSINASKQIGVSSGAEILSDVGKTAVGQGGEITINTDSLSLSNQALLSTGSEGEGSAGSLSINAHNKVLIDNAQVNSTLEFGKGNGGKIKIDTDSLTIANNGKLAVSTEGPTGNGGDLNVNANSIYLLNQGAILANTQTGNGGDINLTVRDILFLQNNSQISTTAGSENAPGNGGNITINAKSGFIIALPSRKGDLEVNPPPGSDITANAFSGSGGKVSITSKGIFGMVERSRSDWKKGVPIKPQEVPTNDITAISQQNPALDGQVAVNTNVLGGGLTQTPQEPRSTEVTDNCQVSNGKESVQFFDIGRGGLPPRPEDPLSIDLLEWASNPIALSSQSPPTNEASQTPPDLASRSFQTSSTYLKLLPPCQSR